jgi:hypothetical protein
MAKSSKLRIMISSRCNDLFPISGGKPLSDIRRELKKEIEAFEVFGRPVFEVWINEQTPAQGSARDLWDVCVEEVKDCDIFLCLSNGNAGWASGPGELGICHAELMTGLSIAPAKVRLIGLPNVLIAKTSEGQRNRRFQEYVATQSLFGGGSIATIDDLRNRVKGAISDALIALAQAGVRDSAKAKFSSGQALDWSRMNFETHQEEMRRVVQDALLERKASRKEGDTAVIVRLSNTEVLVVPNAIPAAVGIAAARERVGQPFLRDHEFSSILKENRGGPLHMIACHRTATEAQAVKLLGFPDATVVTAPFGIFVADNIQKVQFAFIVNCRDETNTRYGIQRFFEWMAQTGEETLVAERATARARIVRAIAKEALSLVKT